MEKQIKALCRQLSITYAAYIATALIFAAVYELLPEAKGSLANSPKYEYVLGIICLLLTITIATLSIKPFTNLLIRHKSLSLDERIARYRTMWNIRIASFEIITIFDLWAYFSTLDNIGGFCALICITVSILFVPTSKRVHSDLNINND